MHVLLQSESRLCKVSLPLLLRLFEYIREEPITDEDLHFMAERMSELAWDGISMTMNHYTGIIPKQPTTKGAPAAPIIAPLTETVTTKTNYYKTTQTE